jgi:endonuclease YncB( thermonuclease family)
MTTKRWGLMVFAVVLMVFAAVANSRGWLRPINSKALMHAQPGSYAVKQFVDGDTVMVDMQGTTETIRFIGIDTPETHKPNTPVQCYGPAAAAYTKNRIGSQRIRLVSDALTTNRDRYNRLLRYVVLEDGTYLNKELVQKGYAFAYAFPFAKSDEFHATMEQAQKAKAGLWGNCAPYQDPNTGQWHTPSQ